MSFLMLLLEMYMAMMHFPQRERELGSALFGAWLMLANACINIVFLALCLLRSTLDSHAYFDFNSGLWPILMLLMTQRMLGDPEGVSSFWGLFTMKNKWYPLVLVGIFSLLNATVTWSLFAGVGLGYLSFFKPEYNFERMMPSSSRLAALDRFVAGRSFMGAPWLNIDAAGGSSSSYGGQQCSPPSQGAQPRTWGQSMFSQASKESSGAFALFSGQGNRLGDGSPPSAAKPPTAARGSKTDATDIEAQPMLSATTEEKDKEMSSTS